MNKRDTCYVMRKIGVDRARDAARYYRAAREGMSRFKFGEEGNGEMERWRDGVVE
ncbi:MAG: hypothetical protein O2857_11695 [Planctomycetota bacterium]|nr:hypothetical protein [Planctomycetota bacterium]